MQIIYTLSGISREVCRFLVQLVKILTLSKCLMDDETEVIF